MVILVDGDVVVERQRPFVDVERCAGLGLLGDGGLVVNEGGVVATAVGLVEMLCHGEVLVVQRVAEHAYGLGVRRLGSDAQHQVVALLHLAFQLVPLDGVGERFQRVLVDGCRPEDGFGRVGRVSLIECYVVLELDGVLPGAVPFLVPSLTPLHDDAVADEDFSCRLVAEHGFGQCGLLEDVGRVLRVVFGLAILCRQFQAAGLVGRSERGVVEAEEQDVGAALVLDKREVEVAGLAVDQTAGRDLQGIDGRGVFLPFVQIGLRQRQRGGRQP